MRKTIKTTQCFSQRIGTLIEKHIIKENNLFTNNRQRIKGYYDGYDSTSIFEIKAAKDKNYFRIRKDNHKQLQNSGCGYYILVNYKLKDDDKGLKLISDIIITNTTTFKADKLLLQCNTIKEDRRGKHEYYKVKINGN